MVRGVLAVHRPVRKKEKPVKNTRQLSPCCVAGGLVVLILLGMVSCTTIIPELQVHYTLPTPSDQVKGRDVRLTIEDRRTDTSILKRGAREEFKIFSNNVALRVSDGGAKETNIGIFQVASLMREAFQRRLARSGITVVSGSSENVPELVISIKEFSLDLAGREWLAKMSYEARLTGEDGAVATQSVNGQATRYKVMGRDAADDLMSEIFTDMVNALNMARLFDQAELWE